jgi:hypothetical protein
LGGVAPVVNKSHCRNSALSIATVCEIGKTFTVRNSNGMNSIQKAVNM